MVDTKTGREREEAKGCMECDYPRHGEHIKAELDRVARAIERMDERLHDLESALEDRDLRLHQTVDERARQHAEIIEKLRVIVEQSRHDVGKMSVKLGVFGGIAGFVSIIGVVLWEVLRRVGGR